RPLDLVRDHLLHRVVPIPEGPTPVFESTAPIFAGFSGSLHDTIDRNERNRYERAHPLLLRCRPHATPPLPVRLPNVATSGDVPASLPPSMTSVVPVMNAAAGEQSHTTSVGTAIAIPPQLRTSSTMRSIEASSRAARTTADPAPANARATSAPIPRLAPV